LFTVPGKVSANSLFDEIASQIDTRISSVSTPSTSLTLFTTRGAGAGTTWVKNTNIWTNQSTDIDWTGIASWNSSGGYLNAGTLISPKHVLMAAHYAIPNGAIITFVKNDNTVVTKTLVSQTYIGNDITVGILDSAVPAGITFYSLPPTMSDLASRLGILTYNGSQNNNIANLNIPVVSFDQEKKSSIHQVTYISDTEIQHIHYSSSTSATRYQFSHPTVPGDSGNPIFMLIDDTPILVATHYSSVSGPYFGGYISAINSAMDTLSGSNEYSPQQFSISSYVVSSPGTPDMTSASDTNISSDNITASTTPSFTIACSNSSTVNIFVNSTAVTSGSCSSSSFTYTSTALADGDYTIDATQTIGSATSGTSTALAFTIDSSVPTTPVFAPDLLDISDTGASSTDNYTTDSLPKFSVSCTVGNTVDLYVDSTLSGSTACVGSISIVQVNSSVSYGVKTVAFRQKDTAGNTSSSSPSLVVNFNTQPTSSLVIADGTLDTTFNPGGTGANSSIYSIKYQASTRKYIIAGAFTSYNTALGTTSVGRIARLHADGTLDTTFNPGGGGANQEIIHFGFQPDGKIIIVGSFTSYNTASGTTTVGRIARLNADGTLDATYNAGTGFSTGVFGTAGGNQYAIVDSSGRLLAGGISSTSYTYNGAVPQHRNFIRINADGTLDTSFNLNGNGFGNSMIVAKMIQLESGKYLVSNGSSAGTYHDATNGTTTGASLVRINQDGTRDMTFNTGGVGFSLGNSFSTRGSFLYEDVDTNDIYMFTNVGESSVTYNGNALTSAILKISADGTTIDTSYNTGLMGNGYKVESATYIGDGRFAVGLRTSGAGTANFSWGPFTLGDTLNPMRFVIVKNGGVDTSFNHKIVSTTYETLPDSLGRLLIVGTFSTYDGVATRGIARITKSSTPSALRFVATSPNKTYKVGDSIGVAAILSEPVRTGSTMNIALDTGTSVTLTASATSTSLQGSYVVQEGDTSADLSVASISSASVVDSLGTTVTSFSVPSDNIDDVSDIIIDGTRPTANIPTLVSTSDTGILSTDNITNDITPTFSVSCVSGESISLFNTATFIASSTCSSSPVEITTPVLDAGTYNVVSVVTDINGNVSATSTPATVVILDIVYSGSAPNMPDLVSDSDSGDSSIDNITNDTTPTFVGTCVTGEQVSLSINGDVPVVVTCTGSQYSYTPTIASEGQYTLVSAFVDAAGNASLPSAGLSFTISASAVVTPAPVVVVPTSSPTAYSVATLSQSEIQTIFGKKVQTPSISTSSYNTKSIASTGTSSGAGVTFTANSSKNSKTNKPLEVRALQVFLNKNGYTVSKSGAGSPGRETTIFGLQTQRALIRFQKANAIPATGIFDKKTRDFINRK
jgi:uncharacterized delta-60 repeat protein